jgi:hypothetical protein
MVGEVGSRGSSKSQCRPDGSAEGIAKKIEIQGWGEKKGVAQLKMTP